MVRHTRTETMTSTTAGEAAEETRTRFDEDSSPRPSIGGGKQLMEHLSCFLLQDLREVVRDELSRLDCGLREFVRAELRQQRPHAVEHGEQWGLHSQLKAVLAARQKMNASLCEECVSGLRALDRHGGACEEPDPDARAADCDAAAPAKPLPPVSSTSSSNAPPLPQGVAPQLYTPVVPQAEAPRLPGCSFGTVDALSPSPSMILGAHGRQRHGNSFASDHLGGRSGVRSGHSTPISTCSRQQWPRHEAEHAGAGGPPSRTQRGRISTRSRGSKTLRLTDAEARLDKSILRHNNLLEDSDGEGESPCRSGSRTPPVPGAFGVRKSYWTGGHKAEDAQFAVAVEARQNEDGASEDASVIMANVLGSLGGGWLAAPENVLRSDGVALDDDVLPVDSDGVVAPMASLEDTRSSLGKRTPDITDIMAELRGRESQARSKVQATGQTILTLQQERRLSQALELFSNSDAGSFVLKEGTTGSKLAGAIRETLSSWADSARWRCKQAFEASVRLFIFVAGPGLGLVLWSKRCPRTSVLYHLLILGLLGASTALFMRDAVANLKEDAQIEAAAALTDASLSLGAFVGLLSFSVYRRGSKLRKCSAALRRYGLRLSASSGWDEIELDDMLWTPGLWVVAVALRVGPSLLEWELPPLIQTAAFALSITVLFAVMSYIVHACRFLVKMCDAFCFHMPDAPTYAELFQEWQVLHALLRHVSSALSYGIITMMALATAAAILAVDVVIKHGFACFLGPAPAIVLSFGILRACVWAASVTEKFKRMPALVNNIDLGNRVSGNVMWLIQHIERSQAGFYVCSTLLTMGGVGKAIYATCAVAVGLATTVV